MPAPHEVMQSVINQAVSEPANLLLINTFIHSFIHSSYHPAN